MSHDWRDILRRAKRLTGRKEVFARLHAVMIGVAVSDQHGIQMGDLRGQDWLFDHDLYVEAFQQRIDHESRASRVDHKAFPTQPAESGGLARLEHVRAK